MYIIYIIILFIAFDIISQNTLTQRSTYNKHFAVLRAKDDSLLSILYVLAVPDIVSENAMSLMIASHYSAHHFV